MKGIRTNETNKPTNALQQDRVEVCQLGSGGIREHRVAVCVEILFLTQTANNRWRIINLILLRSKICCLLK